MQHIISLRLRASCPDDSLRSADLYGSTWQSNAPQVLWLMVMFVPIYAMNQQLVFTAFKVCFIACTRVLCTACRQQPWAKACLHSHWQCQVH